MALSQVSGPQKGKRARVTKSWRKADAFGESRGGPGTRKADNSGYPFQLTHFSLPISRPLIKWLVVIVRSEALL